MKIKENALIYSLLGGAFGAILFVSVAFFPNFGTALLSSLAAIPLFMVGLSLGRKFLLIALLITCSLIFVSTHPIHGLSFALLYGLPMVILVDRALLNRPTSHGLEWYPLSSLLLWLIGITAAIVVVAVVMIAPYSDPQQLKDNIEQLTGILGPQPEEAVQALGQILPYFPAFFGVSWCFSILINATLAQGLLARFKANQRPSPQLSGLTLPRSLLLLLAASLLFSFFDLGLVTQLAANLLPILLIPFSLVGLGFLHNKVQNAPNPQIFLIMIYAVLILFLWPLLLLAMAGVILTALKK